MSEFGDKFATTGATKLRDVLGDSLTYTNTDVDPATSQALESIPNDVSTAGTFGSKTFVFLVADLTLVATPELGHTITDSDGIKWRIVNTVKDDNGTYVVDCEIPEVRS